MNKKKQEKILEYIENHPRGSTISEISDALNISRVTASKYLSILVAEGSVEQRNVGRAKLHYINREKVEGVSEAGSA